MTRSQHEGTPRDARTKRYVFPPRRRVVLWVSTAVGLLTAVIMLGAYLAGT